MKGCKPTVGEVREHTIGTNGKLLMRSRVAFLGAKSWFWQGAYFSHQVTGPSRVVVVAHKNRVPVGVMPRWASAG